MAECAEPGCPASIKDHRWGRTKATGWFQQRDGPIWCPDHVPNWVETWRRKQRTTQTNNQGEIAMTATTTADRFLMGEAIPALKFEGIGETHTGTITDPPEVRQQTDIKTGEPVFWPSGDPKMQLVVTLQTSQRDNPDDDGKRRIYVKGKSLTEAVREAVKQTGAKGLEVSGTLTVTYVGDGPQPNKAMNPPKLYTATYTRPDTTTASGAFLGVTTPAPAAAVPAATGPTPAQIAALKAAGVDPATVFPTSGVQPPF